MKRRDDTSGPTLDLSEDFRSGFVTLAGQPNVGKSTLLNRLVGEKIAIATPKPQTTRDRIVGIKHVPGGQVVFLDTPGIHQARSKLNQAMVDVAMASLKDVNVVVLMVDLAHQCAKHPDSLLAGDQAIVDAVKRAGSPTIVALNKVDRVERVQVLPVIAAWNEAGPFEAIVPISARDGGGVDALLGEIVSRMPVGPPYYPDDMITDRSMRFLAAELIREKLFLQLGKELPYEVAVEVENWTEDKGMTRIDAVIHVARKSQKRIVVGAGGSRVKQVGIAARQDLERFLGHKVYLKLFVHVEPGWTGSQRSLKRFGYGLDGNAGEGGNR